MAVVPVWTGDRCRLGVDDEMTIYTAAALKPALLDPLDKATEVDVDLSRVGECDTAGFQLLVLLKREAAAGGKRVLFTGHSPAVIKVLDLYNMAGYFGDPLVIPSA